MTDNRGQTAAGRRQKTIANCEFKNKEAGARSQEIEVGLRIANLKAIEFRSENLESSRDGILEWWE